MQILDRAPGTRLRRWSTGCSLRRGLPKAGRPCGRGIAGPRAGAGRLLGGDVGSGAITIVLIFLLLFVSWQTIYAANRDLARAKAWGDLARKALPFLALLLMVLSLFLVQSFGQGQMLLAWMGVSAFAIIGASFL